jgi:hypothetical protein
VLPAPAEPHRELTGDGAQQLVAEYVDALRALGEPAPRRLVGQVAREVGQLVRDGVSAPTIRRCLQLLLERRLNPTTLASLVPEAAAGPPVRDALDLLTADVLAEQRPQREEGEP